MINKKDKKLRYLIRSHVAKKLGLNSDWCTSRGPHPRSPYVFGPFQIVAPKNLRNLPYSLDYVPSDPQRESLVEDFDDSSSSSSPGPVRPASSGFSELFFDAYELMEIT